MNHRLEKYISDKSSPEDPVLEDLYRQTHIRFVNPNMVSGHIQGKFLEFISMMLNPANILEIGTFTGYSAICLARGLREGGKVYTIEINDELADFASLYFTKTGNSDKIVQICGNAITEIEKLDIEFDLAYIDGDKREYVDYYKAVNKKLRRGGYIIADNVLWGGKVLDTGTADPQARGVIAFNDYIREQDDLEKVILPVRDGISIIRKR